MFIAMIHRVEVSDRRKPTGRNARQGPDQAPK